MYKQFEIENRLVERTPLIEVAASAISQKEPLTYMRKHLDDKSIEEMIKKYLHDKDIAEVLQGVREGFCAISDRTGHDGISKSGIFYEVKQNEFIKNKGFLLNLSFDRISLQNYKKFANDRPIIKLFALYEGKLIYDIKISFSDKMLKKYYDKVINGFKQISYSFLSYKDAIIDVCEVNKHLAQYKGTNPLVEYIYETSGKDMGLSYDYKRREAFKKYLPDICKRYAEVSNYAQVGREFSEITGYTMDGSFISNNI